MNSLRLQIDSQFGDYAFTRDADELFVRYKRRKQKIRATVTSLSAVFVVVFAALFANNVGSFFGFSDSREAGFSITAYALENTDRKANVNSEKTLITDSDGVQMQRQRVTYGADGCEIIDGNAVIGGTVEKRTVIVPSPIRFKVSGKDIESLTVECSDNGSLYSESAANLNKGRISYKGNEVINWIPNCEKLAKALSADITMVPSTLENDRLATKELNDLLKTSDDYTKYFGGMVKITANYSGKVSQTITTQITLDKNGRYYVSTSK